MGSISNANTYKKLPPLWMFLKGGQSLKEIIFFAIFLSAISSTRFFPIPFSYVKYIILVYSIYKIISIVLEWKHFGYNLDYKGIHVKSGRFIKTSRYVPLERIQGINEYTPFFHRLLGLTIVLLDVGANDKNGAIKLDMLSYTDAEEIKNIITNSKLVSLSELEQLNPKEGSESNDYPQRKVNYEISNKEIFIGSVTPLRLLLFFTFLYSIYENLKKFFSIELNIDRILSFISSSWWTITLGILILVILSTVYGILRTYLRYGGFEVTSDYNRIYIKKGILNETEFSIPKNKIQAVSISYTFLQKLTGLVKVRIISTNEKDNEDIPTSNILFPFINRKRAESLIDEMLPEFKLHKEMTSIPKLSIIIKLLRTSYIWGMISILIYFFFPSFWYIGVLMAVYVVISQVMSGLFSSYSINSKSIQLRKCTLSVRIFITSQSKIEEFNFSQSLLQRFFGLSSFTITTKESPVKITKMLDVPFDVSKNLYKSYKEKLIYIKQYIA